MQNETFRLIVRRGPQPNQVYELTAEVTNLGRDITNDIVINDREVSRHHLRFTRGTDGCTMEDLGSTNGTFINGKRVTGAISLKNGDMVGLGETVTLQFEANRPGAAVPPPQAAAPAPQATVPSQGQDDARFRPQPQAPQAPAADPYQAARPQQQPYQQQPQPQAQQPYQQQPPADSYAPQPDYYNQQQGAAASYGPPPPGYDYDPYAMRDEEGGNTMQWVLIGCLGLLLICCCATVIAAVAVDTFCLYDLIPGLNNFLGAIGLASSCG
jgi:predicted component of type VI protein secretion system